jgi:hypothetical protein
MLYHQPRKLKTFKRIYAKLGIVRFMQIFDFISVGDVRGTRYHPIFTGFRSSRNQKPVQADNTERNMQSRRFVNIRATAPLFNSADGRR